MLITFNNQRQWFFHRFTKFRADLHRKWLPNVLVTTRLYRSPQKNLNWFPNSYWTMSWKSDISTSTIKAAAFRVVKSQRLFKKNRDPLVNCYILLWKDPPFFLMGKSTKIHDFNGHFPLFFVNVHQREPSHPPFQTWSPQASGAWRQLPEPLDECKGGGSGKTSDLPRWFEIESSRIHVYIYIYIQYILQNNYTYISSINVQY